MKRLLVALLAISIMASPVAAQEEDQSPAFDLSGFGDFVSGIAGSGADVGSQVVQSLSQTLDVGNAGQALSVAFNHSQQNVANIAQGQTDDVRFFPERPDDTPTRGR